jgi:hypothetical protein
LQGVESVDVSLERALTDVRLGEKNAVTLSQIRKIIKDGGFNAGPADIEAIGTLSLKDGHVVLTVAGTREEYHLSEDAASPAALGAARTGAQDSGTRAYVVTGRVESGHDLKVRSIRPQ